MRILFIGQGDSMHTARTLQLTRMHFPDAVFDAFASSPFPCSSFLRSIATCHENGATPPPVVDAYWNDYFTKPTTIFSPKPDLLASLLRQESFDFIHVLCFQEGAYLLRKALEEPGTSAKGAKIIFSLWGNDLYCLGRVPEHREEIDKALAICDRLHADCRRDAQLAQMMGFKGVILPVVSAITSATILQKDVGQFVPAITPPSQRKKIFIRGTNAVRGRSFLAIAAFQRLPEQIRRQYTLLLVNAAPIDINAAHSLTDAGGVIIMPQWISFGMVLQLLSASRLTMSLNTTDGTPQLFWEATATHSYPLFSRDTGLAPQQRMTNNMPNLTLVDPNDVHEIARAMEEALTNDAMVDGAGPCNNAILHEVQSDERLAELFRETYR